jgi:predicted TPR repeat methyltransferase
VTTQETFEYARLQHRSGRLPEAEALYRQILTVEPRHAEALHLLGVLAGQTGRNEVAADFMRRAIALRPDHAEAHKNLGVALKAAGKIDEAISAYREAIALKPDYAEAHKNLGNALYHKGQLSDAIAAYRQAIALQPGFSEALGSLGVALRENGQSDEAVAACRHAVALKPANPEAHNNLGNALHDKGQFAEAISSYRTAIQLKSDFAPACNNLGIALHANGQPEEAISAYRKATELKPDYADAFGNLAHALKDQGRFDEAIAAYRKAIELKPDSPDWQHVVAALTGDHSPITTPASYVRNLFDPYAHEFDDHLVGKLHYRVPEQLLDSVLSVAPGGKFDILDLGCGTGLCGVPFRPYARTLIGVDLSPAMIAHANAKGIYDRLITADIFEAMHAMEENHDLILAGDLFIYVGDLGDVFRSAMRVLRDRGLFAFSIERHDGPGFVLHSKVRFAHSLTYIRDLARTQHFTELYVGEISVRKSGRDDVPGWIVVLQKPSTLLTCP